ncbi:hypothetical protein CN272_27920 [Bacillus anthracis]|nr:hypothetical protein CN272_27920 [Bacillus anthracis]PFD87211.1 hypothetical protein CN275_20290 [Bacillus anthracis]PFT20064.1 hypothetical protein COK52_22780 [Bacillus thuringiensis]
MFKINDEWTFSNEKKREIFNELSLLNTELHTLLKSNKNCSKIFCVTGSNQRKIAACSIFLLEQGHKVILLPENWNPKITNVYYDYMVIYHTKKIVVEINQDPINSTQFYNTDLVYFTSGSTGIPKPIGVTNDQLKLTANWYQNIYKITKDSVICSNLPSTYNFTFVAGIYLSYLTGCNIYLENDHSRLLLKIPSLSQKYDRVVLLANPLVLEWLSSLHLSYIPNLLIDTGGAPVSTEAIKKFRETLGDIREGYGLTETCSLTHFDSVGDLHSIGTVGPNLTGVNQKIVNQNGKPSLYLQSPNRGINLLSQNMNCNYLNEFFDTGDLGLINEKGHLRLLGRKDDFKINGLWPRDTLDILGPMLGYRCAMIRHLSPEKVLVKLWGNQDENLTTTLKKSIMSNLNISKESIQVDYLYSGKLHSYKIPRQ